MKRHFRRIINPVIAAAILMTAAPMVIFAEEEIPAAVGQETQAIEQEDVKEEAETEPVQTEESDPVFEPAYESEPVCEPGPEPVPEPEAVFAVESSAAAETVPAVEPVHEPEAEPETKESTDEASAESRTVEAAAAAAENTGERAGTETEGEEELVGVNEETAEENADEKAAPETITVIEWYYGGNQITPENGVYTAGNEVWDRNEKAKAVSASVQGRDKTIELSVTPAGDNYTAVEPGNYSLAFSAALPDEYKDQYELAEGISSLTVNFSVNKRLIADVNLTLVNDTYTGTELDAPAMCVADGVFAGGDTVDTILSMSPAESGKLEDAGVYRYDISIKEDKAAYYAFPEGMTVLTRDVEVKRAVITAVTLYWKDTAKLQSIDFDGNKHFAAACFTGLKQDETDCDCSGAIVNNTESDGKRRQGRYEYALSKSGFEGLEGCRNYTIDENVTMTLEITPLKVSEIIWDPEEWSGVYDGTDYNDSENPRLPQAYFIGEGNDGRIVISPKDIKVIRYVPGKPDGVIEEGEYEYGSENAPGIINSGTYTVEVRIDSGTQADYPGNPEDPDVPQASDYLIDANTINRTEEIVIAPKEITALTWHVPSVYNGADQAVTVISDDVAEGGHDTENLSAPFKTFQITGVGEEAKEEPSDSERDAGNYQYRAELDPGNTAYVNYIFTEDCRQTAEFTILPRRITIHPDKLIKKFGETDAVPYTYDKAGITDNDEAAVPWNAVDEEGNAFPIRSELPDDLLIRKEGELPGTYEYSMSGSYLEGETVLTNYMIEVDNSVPYEIEKLKLTAGNKLITSREGRFDYATDMLERKGAKADNKVALKLVITAKFPEDTQNINSSENLEDFITDATDGISFTDGKGTVKVKDFTYSTVKRKKIRKWTGKLPAGTELTMTVYGRSTEEHLNEAWTNVSNTAKVTVVKQPVAMCWSSTADEVLSAGYLSKGDKLRLTAVGTEKNGFNYDSKNEVVEVTYNGIRYYQSLDVDTIDPQENNNGSGHALQTATATFVDALNLEYSEASCRFVYDSSAFDIPAENIRFHNRDKKISIELPETGIVRSVTIPGADVRLTGSSGDRFEFDVVWSGRKLISSGSRIQVTYTDQGGNEGKGSAEVAKSDVSTGLQLSVRPAPNAQGYLNGQTDTLIISGFGCVCEPVNVTIAGGQSIQSNVAARDIWNDEAESWEIQLSMHDLPESDEPFTIHAEYTDVIGSPAELSVKYNDFVAPVSVVSPLFRAMTFISGMAETNSTVQMYIGNDKDRRFEAYKDSFGHFVFEDVDLMMPGDTFTVVVTDVAGNQEASTYMIPVPAGDEPATAAGILGPLGQFVFNGQKGTSETYVVTPVNVSLPDDKDLIIPLLFGASYKAGEVKISKVNDGIMIDSSLDPEVFADPENYTVTGDTFYVYTSKPSAGELAAKSGTPYHYGDVIRTEGTGTIWIADGRSLEMPASDVSRLDTYNFRALRDEEIAAMPEADQEFRTYYSCQACNEQKAAAGMPD